MTVILCAGDFPRKGTRAHEALLAATRVVCCDSAAADFRRRLHRWPTAIVGDLDSLSPRLLKAALAAGCQLVRETEQDTNDLAKAIRFCHRRKWPKPLILGATGKRADHALGNIFRALDENLTILTDDGAFIPVRRAWRASLPVGTAISIFAPDSATRLTSKGLTWPLNDVIPANLYCATLNRTSAPRVSLTTTHPVTLFIADLCS